MEQKIKPSEKQQQIPLAVALRYQPELEHAPRVVASGRGEVAKKIIDCAGEHGVPVLANAELAETLAKLDLGAVIPPKLYQVVAEVLAFVYQMDDDYSKRK